jgi:hypothetical protein
VRRDEILPIDHERIAHEEEDRKAREGEEGGFELDINDDREMEALERALEGTGTGLHEREVASAGGGGGEGARNGRWEGKREGDLVQCFEERLAELEGKAFRG